MRWPRYGMHLGTAFQLIDDVLDYSGDHAATGKNLGDDLAEGKPTLPLIYAMKHGTPSRPRSSGSNRARRTQRIRAGARRDPGSGALDYARAQAEAEARSARCAALAAIPHSTYRE